MNEADLAGLAELRHGRIFVAGHQGMVGSALVRRLQAAGCDQLLLRPRSELDLEQQAEVRDFMHAERPDFVFLAAAKVGGIQANSKWPGQFIHSNLAITANCLEAARTAGVRRLLFLGSSCIYPRLAPQPMPEAALLTGPLEPSNEAYAIAKIAGIKFCEAYNTEYGTDYRSVMPTNLYGPNDNFDLTSSHVLPALLRKCHEARLSGASQVEIWGSGTPRREFLHVDDLADACLFVMCLPRAVLQRSVEPHLSHLNVGAGADLPIAELAGLVAETVGYPGRLVYNRDYPDGTPRKLLDVSKLAGLGWQARISLREGLASTYRWYLEHESGARKGGTTVAHAAHTQARA